MSSKEVQRRFIDEILTAHNDYRKLHNSPPLAHNSELSKAALGWALKIAKNDELDHSANKYHSESLGENLAMWFEKGADRFDGKFLSKQKVILDLLIGNFDITYYELNK